MKFCVAAGNPETGIELLVDTGSLDHIFPEIPALRMAPDEHAQHKDVYAHSLTVCTPMARSPTVTMTACTRTSKAISMKRPR